MALKKDERKAVELLEKAFGHVEDKEALEEAVRAITMAATMAMAGHQHTNVAGERPRVGG